MRGDRLFWFFNFLFAGDMSPIFLKEVAMRQPMVTLAVAILLSLSGHSAWGGPQYTAKDLGTLDGGSTSQAYAINASGQVAGNASTSTGAQHAFLYDGTMADLGTLGGTNSYAYGINTNGDVVGYSQTLHDSAENAFIVTGAKMAGLGTLGGTNSRAYAINDSKQIVGWSETGSYTTALGGGSAIGQATSFGGTTTSLGTLGGSNSCAYGINASGNVVGSSQTLGNSAQNAFLYLFNGGVNSTMTGLGTLGGLNSCAWAINDANHVVGYSQISGGANHAFLWKDGAMNDLGTLGGANSYAYGINNNKNGDQVVGSSDTASGAQHAFLYENSTMYDLNNVLINSDPTWTLEEARGVNDAGYIVGWGKVNGSIHAFLLTPVPEPSTLALLGFGAIGLLAYGWRRRNRTA
jgi:probable HAF family extracellular repeat protein